MSELTRLVIQHFAAELELALRAAFQEVVGRPLPPRFTIELGGPRQQTPRRAHPVSPLVAQTESVLPPAVDPCNRKGKRPRPKGGPSRGKPDAKAKPQGR